jgi:hypothetical protein
MTHLGAATFGIAVTAAVLGVYIGRPAAVAPAAPVERQAPIVAEGKSDRLLLPAAEPIVEPPQPQPKPVAIVAPAAEPSIARTLKPPSPREGGDPVCGPRGRTWYVKENGWRFWRCNR